MIPFLIGAAVLAVVVSGIRVAQEYERGVVFRLGRYEATRGPGLYWNMPVFERQRKIDLRTRTVNVEQQETITSDSVTIRVNAVLWFRVTDPQRAVIAVADYRSAVYQVALTSLRNVIGQHDLDEVLRSRDQINSQLAKLVDRATEPWGVQVEAVEMKDVEIPEAMQRAMAREAEAMREKRARIIKAEAEHEASVRLGMAAREIAANPIALELRRLQTVSEVGAENNSTTVLMMPTEFLALASNLNRTFSANADALEAAARATPPVPTPGDGQ
jgi:regulator of protease activity HflC (stomatin/prohibitin superfamily)